MSIIVNALTYRHPDRERLFQNITFSVAPGAKAALVGQNGMGKSTLLQLLAGRLHSSGGDIILSENPYYIPQHLGQYNHYSVAGLLGVEEKLGALHAILQGDVAAAHFTTLADDWDIEERVNAALAYWQLTHVDLTQAVQSLSGGEKTKVFLAGILVHNPSVILLDEPSNHLDAAGRELLYAFIEKSKATMLVVSHDRTLLNLLDTTLELNPGGIETFGGNYDFYREQKEGQLKALQAQADEHTKTLKQTQQKAREMTEQRQKQESRGKAQGQKKALPRIIAGGRKSQAEQSTAKLKEVQADKMNQLTGHLKQIREQIHDDQLLKFDLGASDLHRGKILLEATHINVAYDQRNLWPTPLSFQIRSGERLRIEGNNGSGKTTLLHLLMGRMEPSTGSILRADFQYIYLDQEYTIIDNNLSVYDQIQRFNSRHLLEHELKMRLHQYQFPKESWDRSCSGLSGGEKMKLALCCLMVSTNAPDVLLLDEPTNNLDRQSQEVLILAVKDFAGTIIIISHDAYFVQQIVIDSSISLS